MQALFYPSYGELTIAERPRPEPAAGEVVVAVAACGLCGSELETFRARSSRRAPPLVMGHEFCGVVDELGPGVAGVAPGDRVVINALVPCDTCARCQRGDTHLCGRRQIFGMHRPGAFAEFVAAPARALMAWPDNVDASAACLAEPLGNGIHIVRMTEHLAAAQVVVIGAGPIGLCVLQAFSSLRSSRVLVSDVRSSRLETAARLGAASTVNVAADDLKEAVNAWTGGEGADVVVDAVGSAVTKRDAISCSRPGGACVWIGLHEDQADISTYDVTLAERRVFGTYGATMQDLTDAVELIRNGSADMASWVSQFSLADGVSAFHRMLDGTGTEVKAVLVP